jgi:hypothetical protein
MTKGITSAERHDESVAVCDGESEYDGFGGLSGPNCSGD